MSEQEQQRPEYEITIDKLRQAFGKMAKATTSFEFDLIDKAIHLLFDNLKKINIPYKHREWIVRQLRQIEDGFLDGIMTAALNRLPRQLSKENETAQKK